MKSKIRDETQRFNIFILSIALSIIIFSPMTSLFIYCNVNICQKIIITRNEYISSPAKIETLYALEINFLFIS